MVLEDASVQDHLGEPRQVAGGAEQAGVRGDAAQREGVLVVHLAAQDPAAPGIVLGGRDPRRQPRRRPEHGVDHAQRPEDPLAHEHVERLACDPFQDLAQEDQAQVAVERLAARLVDQLHPLDPLDVGGLALELLVERRPPVDARGVGQQVAHGDPVFGAAGEAGQEVPHRLVEVEPSLVDQDHRHGGGGDHLGQAGEVVDRVGGDRRRVRSVGEAAVGPQMGQSAPAPHRQHGARERPPLEEAGDDGVDLARPAGAQGRIPGAGRGERHRPPRQLDAVAGGVGARQGHRQPAGDVGLAEQGPHGGPLARRRGAVGAQVDRDLGQLRQHIGAAQGDDDQRHSGLVQPPHQVPVGRGQAAAAVCAGHAADEARHQDVAEAGGRGDQFVRRLGRHLAAQGGAAEPDPALPQRGPLDRVRGRVGAACQRQVEQPQRPFRGQRQDAAVVPHQGDRGGGQLLGAPHVLGTRHPPAQLGAIHQPLAVQPQPRLDLEQPPHRGLDPGLGELPLADRPDHGLDGDPAVAGQQQDVAARLDGAHRRLAGPRRAQAGHLEGVGDDQAVEAELVTQQLAAERR